MLPSYASWFPQFALYSLDQDNVGADVGACSVGTSGMEFDNELCNENFRSVEMSEAS